MIQPQEPQLELTQDDINHLLAAIAHAVRTDPVQGMVAGWYRETWQKLSDFVYEQEPQADSYILTKVIKQPESEQHS